MPFKKTTKKKPAPAKAAPAKTKKAAPAKKTMKPAIAVYIAKVGKTKPVKK